MPNGASKPVPNGVAAAAKDATETTNATVVHADAPTAKETAPVVAPVVAKSPATIDSFPELSQHHNCMADVLTPDMYARLKDLKTATG